MVRVEINMMACERPSWRRFARSQGISEECIKVRHMGTVLNRGSIVIDYNEVCWSA